MVFVLQRLYLSEYRLKLVDIEMGLPRKFDKNTALDLAACNFNITLSIGIIMVNKVLTLTHGFWYVCAILKISVFKHRHP
jgi:hypothetical protein